MGRGVFDLGDLHHLGYIVDDVEKAAMNLTELYGGGPWISLEEVPLHDVLSQGEPAEFRHGSAFGMVNGVPVELAAGISISPASVAEQFAPKKPFLHHLAYVVPEAELEAVRAELDARGMPEYLRAQFGDDVDYSYHDAKSVYGHDLEIHADSAGLRGFFEMIAGGAKDWDGSEPIRSPMH
jgi:hypothetical protein